MRSIRIRSSGLNCRSLLPMIETELLCVEGVKIRRESRFAHSGIL